MKLLRCLGLAPPKDDWRDSKEKAMDKARGYHNEKKEPCQQHEGGGVNYLYATGTYPINF